MKSDEPSEVKDEKEIPKGQGKTRKHVHVHVDDILHILIKQQPYNEYRDLACLSS